SSGLSVASYRDTVRAEVAWQRIVVGRFGSRVKVSPDRVKEAVSRIQASANKTQYSVSEIFIESPTPEEDAQTLKGAQTLVQKLRAGDSFKTTAEIYSYAPSAATGGNIGWVLAGELRPEVAAVVDKVETGQVSDPIKVQGGYMIIGVAGKHEAKDLTTTYTLKQISKNLAANSDDANTRKVQSQLLASKSQVKGNCANIERVAKANGLSANNLGSIEDKDLNPELLAAISNLPQGGSTEIMRTKNGLNITFMCEKVISGEDIPTAEQIEDNLHDQELNLIARRYLRDIRRDAAIVKR
ncbi:MAG: peptidylprolyl isomerase, partial [Caulobacterales bacterium]|nr:peptidylprolyl isomerase [Caulobacterales bacterium]